MEGDSAKAAQPLHIAPRRQQQQQQQAPPHTSYDPPAPLVPRIPAEEKQPPSTDRSQLYPAEEGVVGDFAGGRGRGSAGLRGRGVNGRGAGRGEPRREVSGDHIFGDAVAAAGSEDVASGVVVACLVRISVSCDVISCRGERLLQRRLNGRWMS